MPLRRRMFSLADCDCPMVTGRKEAEDIFEAKVKGGVIMLSLGR